MPTFSNPWPFSVVLSDATPATFERLRLCFGEPLSNTGYAPDE